MYNSICTDIIVINHAVNVQLLISSYNNCTFVAVVETRCVIAAPSALYSADGAAMTLRHFSHIACINTAKCIL